MLAARPKYLCAGVLLGWILLLGPAAASAQPTVDPVLDQLQQMAQSAVSHISALRIEKWKTDSNTKRSAQSDADSLQRNMASALPELIGKLRATPQDLSANFKLYRNVEVLYDVFSRFAETTGAFGPRDDFDALSRDLESLEAVRHSLGDRLETLTASSQGELDRLRAQLRAAQQAAAAPPKKIVVDDNQPTPAHKKKPAAKPAGAAQKNGSPAPAASPAKTP